jgi:hypothetical protein
MSAKATIWAWNQAETLPSTSVLVTLLALADGARDNGKVWQSNQYLATKTHQSTRSITNALKALADPDGLNLIQIENGASFYRTVRLNFSPVTIFPDGPEADDDAKHVILGRKFQDLEPNSKAGAPRSKASALGANKPKDITQVKNPAPNGAEDASGPDEEEDF